MPEISTTQIIQMLNEAFEDHHNDEIFESDQEEIWEDLLKEFNRTHGTSISFARAVRNYQNYRNQVDQ